MSLRRPYKGAVQQTDKRNVDPIQEARSAAKKEEEIVPKSMATMVVSRLPINVTHHMAVHGKRTCTKDMSSFLTFLGGCASAAP